MVLKVIRMVYTGFEFDKELKIEKRELNPLLSNLKKHMPLTPVDERKLKLDKEYIVESLNKQIRYEKSSIVQVPSILRQNFNEKSRREYVINRAK